MADWKCNVCGFEKEARCKPRKCPECEGKDTFEKKSAKEEK
jgi:rubrerythrin